MGCEADLKSVIQRVRDASVLVEGRQVSAIGRGLLILFGVEKGDRDEEVVRMARKILSLRIFQDESGRMNHAVEEVGGELLVVSQFTLAATIGRGRRPGFDSAAPPEVARALYDRFVAELSTGPVPVRTGIFGAMMQVQLCNDGPVTFIVQGGAD